MKTLLIICLACAWAAMPMTSRAHDKCDSLGIAATAGGVFWAPVAGFQVGYFLAKFIDESTSNAADPNLKFKENCAVGVLSREQYAAIVSPQGEDPNQDYKFLWDEAGELVRKSLTLSQAIHAWQLARLGLRDASVHGDDVLVQKYRMEMNQAHSAGMQAFANYQTEHFVFAEYAAGAAGLFQGSTRVPPMTVDDVVASSKAVLANGPPPFEARYFDEIGCLVPETINPAGVLAPDYRFINDPMPPGTFLNEAILSSPSALYREIAKTFGNEVVQGLDAILPEGFVKNEPLPLHIAVITSGIVGENKEGIAPGTVHQTDFMLDLTLRPIAPGIWSDPWRWHWIVGKPWDWLFGFRIEVVFDIPWPGPGPDPGPLDRLRIVVPYDDPRTDMVMGELGTEFIQDLYFPPGILSKERLPNVTELAKSRGGFFTIMSPAGEKLLDATLDRIDPDPIHLPVTTKGTIGANKLGIQPGTGHQTSFMLDQRLTSVFPGFFKDPWWWHWIVGKPWDWLFGFQLEVRQRIFRPGPDPGPYDLLRITAPYDDAIDMVMGLERGSKFVENLYFPAGTLDLLHLPDPAQWSLFAGGDFRILNPRGQELLTGTIDEVAPGISADSDGDGVDNFNDNCTEEANAGQQDTDKDGYGNACDPDFNGNGVVDVLDFSMMKKSFGSREAPNQDLNGNGVVDVLDFSKLKAYFGKPPGPSVMGMMPMSPQ